MIPSENISALTQNSFCRCLKHASPVADMEGNVAESYVYDPAGNILSKTVNGKTTTYTYDKANQVVSSVCNGKITKYQYDAAGRLIQEGDKSYAYGWLDKVLSVTENGQQIASFNYHNDGQIAQKIRNGKSEDFLWDGLALIHRGETSFINEPYVTGGNPILSSKDGVMFNDMLGSTLNIGGKSVSMTSFGESADNDAMYTGKPYIGELGFTFLFRNYRSDYGKWQTTDPLGYPDGWNNLAYCNNGVTIAIDWQGTNIYQVHDKEGAGGAGHSAWIAQGTNGKFYTFDFNPKGSIGTRNQVFNSLNDALNFLNQDSNRYESYLEFDTTLTHGDSFKDEINNYIAQGYSLTENNCYTVGAEAFNKNAPITGGLLLHKGISPNFSYTKNIQNGGKRHVLE